MENIYYKNYFFKSKTRYLEVERKKDSCDR